MEELKSKQPNCHPERPRSFACEGAGESKDPYGSTNHVGTAAIGCSAERSSASFSKGLGKPNATCRRVQDQTGRALLARTAEGGCPDVLSWRLRDARKR